VGIYFVAATHHPIPLESLDPTPEALGRPRVHALREIVDAIFYIVRSSRGGDEGVEHRRALHGCGEVYAQERPEAFLPKRWIVERTLSWLSQNSNRLESQGVRV
jgi:hypothetical protein